MISLKQPNFITRGVAVFLKDLPAKMIAVLFSVILWLLASSNQVYEYNVVLPLQVEKIPEHLVLVNDLPDTIEVMVSGKGRELFQLNFTRPTIYLRIDQLKVGKNTQLVSLENISIPRGFDLELVKVIQPTAFLMEFDEVLKKRLPVTVPQKNNLIPNLTMKTPFSWSPRQAEVKGPSLLVNKMSEIDADTLDLSRIIANGQFSLQLRPPAGETSISFHPESVRVNIQVEQLLTFEYKDVPVRLINIDENKVDFSPRMVKVMVTIPESSSRPYKNLQITDFSLVVDARYYRNEELTLPVWIQSPAYLIKKATIEPAAVLISPRSGD